MIEICVNGELLQLAQDMSVSEFLRQRGHDLRLVALERDGEILKKEANLGLSDVVIFLNYVVYIAILGLDLGYRYDSSDFVFAGAVRDVASRIHESKFYLVKLAPVAVIYHL